MRKPSYRTLYAHKSFVGWVSGLQGLEKYKKYESPLAHLPSVNTYKKLKYLKMAVLSITQKMDFLKSQIFLLEFFHFF